MLLSLAQRQAPYNADTVTEGHRTHGWKPEVSSGAGLASWAGASLPQALCANTAAIDLTVDWSHSKQLWSPPHGTHIMNM